MKIVDKKLIAEWMGWKYSGHPFKDSWTKGEKICGVTMTFSLENEFNPEQGGDDLTMVLKNLSDEQFMSMLMIIPIKFTCGLFKNVEEFKDVMLYLMEKVNAPTICEAIVKVIKS